MNEDWITPFEIATTPILQQAGHEKVDILTYKARWSSADVEHFIYFKEGGKTKGLFSGYFGIRNTEAEAFSVNAIRRYSGEFHFQVLRYNEHTTCTMRFYFGVFVPPLWDIYAPTLSTSEIGKLVEDIVTKHVCPAIQGVTTIEKLMSLLLQDEHPCPWARTNGAIRAAQIVVLGGKCGLDFSRIRSALEPRLAFVAHGFHKTSPFRKDPSAYLDKVFADWIARSPDGANRHPG
jgi:hypothetical protein